MNAVCTTDWNFCFKNSGPKIRRKYFITKLVKISNQSISACRNFDQEPLINDFWFIPWFSFFIWKFLIDAWRKRGRISRFCFEPIMRKLHEQGNFINWKEIFLMFFWQKCLPMVWCEGSLLFSDRCRKKRWYQDSEEFEIKECRLQCRQRRRVTLWNFLSEMKFDQ